MAGADLFDLAERKLSWLGRRQEALSQNVANANTPGFQSKDIEPFSAQLARSGGALALDNSSHLHIAGIAQTPATQLSRNGGRSPDRNTVILEDQLTKIADTSMNQQLVENIYRKYTGLFRLALGRG